MLGASSLTEEQVGEYILALRLETSLAKWRVAVRVDSDEDPTGSLSINDYTTYDIIP